MSCRILLVDDNPVVLKTLRVMLQSNGYSVTAVQSATAALVNIAEPYDLVVMDYELPDLNGDLLAQVLSNRKPRLPIILFSGCLEPPSNALHEFTAVVSCLSWKWRTAFVR